MEIANAEVGVFEDLAKDEEFLGQLNELELAFVGGGAGDVVIG